MFEPLKVITIYDVDVFCCHKMSLYTTSYCFQWNQFVHTPFFYSYWNVKPFEKIVQLFKVETFMINATFLAKGFEYSKLKGCASICIFWVLFFSHLQYLLLCCDNKSLVCFLFYFHHHSSFFFLVVFSSPSSFLFCTVFFCFGSAWIRFVVVIVHTIFVYPTRFFKSFPQPITSVKI